eukprot:CAMPEP_0113661502 /NCGR_PEP_ID=MMETSP0038_2-20120614/5_1 /TAXON_ID=2898 /ORGANISM="Cryptomonas paramecium" /LENGTH=100 /DNA_ID=CAMNT_0000576191 /DNA_START=6 /DNA_END=308 /DNA_ORIENTATION=+ /assembly_acc=CAM_ASM_000170
MVFNVYQTRNSWGCRGDTTLDPIVSACVAHANTNIKLGAPKSWGSSKPQSWGPTAWVRNAAGNVQTQGTHDKYTFLDCVKKHTDGICALKDPKLVQAVFK